MGLRGRIIRTMLSLFQPTLYVQLTPERLTLSNPKTGESISEVPEIAFSGTPKPKIVAVGKEAQRHAKEPNVTISNPFAHPRTLISDFTLAEQVVKAFLSRIQTKQLLTIPPHIVLHPLEEPLGGWTQIEVRALLELGYSAGAKKVTLWQGVKLSDHELLAGTFPASGQRLS